MTSITQAAADADDPAEWVLLTWDGAGHLTVYSDAHAGRDVSCQLAEAPADIPVPYHDCHGRGFRMVLCGSRPAADKKGDD